MLALSLFFALALDSGMMRLAKFIRLGIFVPYAVPSVVAALIWGYLYGQDFGPFAQLAGLLGLPPPNFLSEGTILFSIVNIVNWEFIGYNMIIIYAALRSIPHELYEAARVDGASEPRIALSIKIPAIRPALLLTVIFSVIGTFQLFNEPKLLRSLAPTVIGTDWTPNLYAYNVAFVNQDANYAAALAFLLGIVIMALSYIVQLWQPAKGAPVMTNPHHCRDRRDHSPATGYRFDRRGTEATQEPTADRVHAPLCVATSCCRCGGCWSPPPSPTPTCSAPSASGSPTST